MENNIIQLYIWKLERTDDHYGMYNIYDSFIVAFSTLEKVQQWSENQNNTKYWNSWTDLKNVKITEIGIANSELNEGDIICCSYNAG